MAQLIIQLTTVRMSGRVVKWNHLAGNYSSSYSNQCGVGMEVMETSEGKWNKQKQGQKRWNYFAFCTSFCILHSAAMYFSEVLWEPYVQLLGTQQLTALQQNNIQPTSHLDSTWQILRNCRDGVASQCRAGGGGRVGGKCAWLIVGVTKPFAKTAPWRETSKYCTWDK